MAFISGSSRFQTQFFSLDDFISDDNDVRVINAFVDGLDLQHLGFNRPSPNRMGAPSYLSSDLLKIYIYSYPKKIRSSRRIEAECTRNIELMWLVNQITPDHRTISDFRKDNIIPIKNILKEFNKLCLDLNVYSRELSSLDGSKFKAVNSKDNNFTKDKLKDRLKRLDAKVDQHLETLKKMDEDDSFSLQDKIDINEKLNKAREKATQYNNIMTTLTDSGESQISLTDKDSRLMKCNNNMLVGFNAQVNVDTQSHIITSVNVSNKPNDNGFMHECGLSTKEAYGVDTVEQLADGGYVDTDDIKKCFEDKIIPILPEGEYKFSYEYKENNITDEVMKGNTKDDIIKCFENGVIPKCYSNLDMEISINEEYIRVNENACLNKTDTNILKQKAKEGFFVRDKLNNCVYCPNDNTLQFKREKKESDLFIGNSKCVDCKNKCTKHVVREVDMPKGVDITSCGKNGKRIPIHMVTTSKKKVTIIYRPDKDKYKLRKNTSEHPFGTLKRAHDASYFLLKGVDKVEGELVLSVLGYNIKRLINIIGVEKLIEYLNNRNIKDISSHFDNIFTKIFKFIKKCNLALIFLI